MDRYQFEDLVSAYIENELSLSKRKEVESYLAENPLDKELIKQVSLYMKTLKNSPKIAAKENFNKRLLERIKSENSHLAHKSKSEKTLFGFSVFHASILISLFAVLFILSLEITESTPRFQNSGNKKFVESKNILDKKEINKQLDEEEIPKTNFTDFKNDTTKKEKRDFSKNIKYVND
ncbi:MAG: hypothetical protein CMF99_00155 [Candidatus Marinimicrobia bacterium]|nr:hypothetical protein [Candidatus Neomarinimicrobiota bacterium]|tara:strand:- start:931 stop:1464 length:534 start_codon:yes stop_codon:yes gene_type:complete